MAQPQQPFADAEPAADGLRIAVVVSRYNQDVTGALASGAAGVFYAAGGAADNLEVVQAPGAFELPVLCAVAARSGRFDAVVALGCLVQGQTPHDRVIADSVAHALASLSTETGVPVAFGLLTAPTMQHARARAGGDRGNKGEEAMRAVLVAVHGVRLLRQDKAAQH